MADTGESIEKCLCDVPHFLALLVIPSLRPPAGADQFTASLPPQGAHKDRFFRHHTDLDPASARPPRDGGNTVRAQPCEESQHDPLPSTGGPILFGTRLAGGACTPSPLVGEGRDGGNYRYQGDTRMHPHPDPPPSRGRRIALASLTRAVPNGIGRGLEWGCTPAPPRAAEGQHTDALPRSVGELQNHKAWFILRWFIDGPHT
jgi:hypothetical protein